MRRSSDDAFLLLVEVEPTPLYNVAMLAREGPFLLEYVRASEQDEARIRQFLGQFASDYLMQVFPQYINTQSGGFYLALDENSKVVGTAALTLVRPHEAYFVGMRIVPESEMEGVARGLTDFQMAEALKLGARVVRVLVEESNQTSLHVLQDELHFGVAVPWEVGDLRDLPAAKAAGQYVAGPAWAVDRARLFEFFGKRSNPLWAGDDLWHPRSLQEEDLAKGFEVGGAAVAPQDVEKPVTGLLLYQVKNRECLNISYLESDDPASTSALLDYLLVEAQAWGATEIRYGLSQEKAKLLAEEYGRKAEDVWRGWLLERVLQPSPIHS